MKIIKQNGFLLTAYFLTAFLFVVYDPPLGLMDDFGFVGLVEMMKENFIETYITWMDKRIFDKGMFQPLYLIQAFLQYNLYFKYGSLPIYLLNALIVYCTHFVFVKGLNNFMNIEINYTHTLLVFLILPFTYDLFIHPSLQEKLIFLFFGISLILHQKKKENNLYIFLIFLSGLSIPLIKLQGAIFIFFYLALIYKDRGILSKSVFFGYIVGFLIQAYVVLFLESSYFVIKNSINNIISNALHPFNILTLIFTILFMIVMKKKLNIFFICLALSLLSLMFLYLNWSIYGYLLASYSYLISFLSIPLLVESSRFLNMKFITSTNLIFIFFLISVSIFFIPRLERWSDLRILYTDLEEQNIGTLYYCASEGTMFLNKISNPENKIIQINNPSEIVESEFNLIHDTYCGSNFYDMLSNCNKEHTTKDDNYGYVFTAKYKC